MGNFKKYSILIFTNLLLFFLLDLFFGYLAPAPPEYLNTKNQYTSNYRNYFKQFVDQNGDTFWGVDNSAPVDVNYKQENFLPNSIKVLAIGDSFTAGQGVKQQDTWIKKLESLPNSKKLYGINHGYSGANIQDIYNVFKKEIQKTIPDLVIYAYVLNDPISKATVVMDLDFDDKNSYPHDQGIFYDLINYRSIVFDKNRNPYLAFLYDNSHFFKFLISALERKNVSDKTIKYYQNLHDPLKNKA